MSSLKFKSVVSILALQPDTIRAKTTEACLNIVKQERDLQRYNTSVTLETTAKVLIGKTNHHGGKSRFQKRNSKPKDSDDRPRCPHCKKLGHKEEDCWIKHPEKKPIKNSEPSIKKRRLRTNVCRILRASKTYFAKDVWADDSGASEHITNDKSKLLQYRPARRNDIEITLADGRHIKGLGTGTVRLGKLELKDVIFAPAMEVNLISTRALTAKGYMLLHKGVKGFVLDNEWETLLETTYDIEEGLYVVPNSVVRGTMAKATISADTTSSTSKKTEEFVKWHRRLGHINPARMRVMANSQLVDGLRPGIFNIPKTPTCEACTLGKQNMLLRKKMDTPLG
jgi:hypothetical protein